jgi:hypothetical protein
MRSLQLLVLAACTKPPPTPTPPPPPLLADAGAVADASVPDAPPDAALPRIHKWVIDEAPGEGRCKVDADCELSSWQPGCCTGTCTEYAISKRELAARKKTERCKRATPCPPPAPCPRPTHMPIDAFCKEGACWARRNVVPPPRDSDF